MAPNSIGSVASRFVQFGGLAVWFFWHPLFQVHAQAVGDAVDVVEIGDDLRGVVDGRVGKTCDPQLLNVVGSDRSRCARQFFGVGEQRLSGGIELRRAPIRLDGIRQFFLDLSPEVVPVGFDSIVAIVSLRNDDRQHLALRPCEPRRPVHSAEIDVHRGA